MTPAQALALPPTPPPVLGTPARGLAAVTPLVTATDSEPTHLVSPAPDAPDATAMLFPESDSGPIESVTITPDPEAAVAPAAGARAGVRRRGLAALGIGMGLAIVGLAALGVRLVRDGRPSAGAAPAALANARRETGPLAPVVNAVPPAPGPARRVVPPSAVETPVVAPAAARPPVAAAPLVEAPAAQKPAAGHRHRSHSHGHHAAEETQAAVPVPAPRRPPAPAPVEHPDPRPFYEEGNALLFAGNSKSAIAAYREAIRAAPNDPSAFRGLGLAYEQQGAPAYALRALRRYLKLAPDAPDREIISRRIEGLAAGVKPK